MAGFSDPLCFMGTNKIKDKADRLSAIEARTGNNDSTENDENGVSHRRTRFTDQSNIRVHGGKAAGPKPIKANYDADDARIVDLKQQGYSDEFVSRKLAEEGRIRYVARTIGSRWLRIRKALEAKEEEILEDEMSDWHDGEDEQLEQAVKEIDGKIEKEIAKLQEKKWLQVAAHIAELINKKKYTAKLCRQRYDGLMDGTALKAIELDSDQEGRAEMRRSRIANNKRLREEAAAAQELEEQQKAAALAAKKEARAANAVVKITKLQQKKIDEEKIAAMKKAAAAQRKAQKLVMLQWANYNKVEAAWFTRKQNAERVLCNKLQGLPLSYRRPTCNNREEVEAASTNEFNRIEEVQEDQEEVAVNDEALTEDEVVHDEASANKHKHHLSSASGSDNPAPRKKQATSSSSPSTTSANSVRRSTRLSTKSKSKSASPKPKHILPGSAEVTNQTRNSPRSNMTIDELDAVCVRRDLPRPSPTFEAQEHVVARLDMEDRQSTNKELNDALRAAGLSAPSKARKEDKVKMLQEYDAEGRDV